MLFTDDTAGRHIGDPPTACKDAEGVMVDNAETVQLTAVFIAASRDDNASARCFTEAVDPDYVIFSAGHRHLGRAQPNGITAATASRSTACSVPTGGDHEGCTE